MFSFLARTSTISIFVNILRNVLDAEQSYAYALEPNSIWHMMAQICNISTREREERNGEKYTYMLPLGSFCANNVNEWRQARARESGQSPRVSCATMLPTYDAN